MYIYSSFIKYYNTFKGALIWCGLNRSWFNTNWTIYSNGRYSILGNPQEIVSNTYEWPIVSHTKSTFHSYKQKASNWINELHSSLYLQWYWSRHNVSKNVFSDIFREYKGTKLSIRCDLDAILLELGAAVWSKYKWWWGWWPWIQVSLLEQIINRQFVP